MFSKYLIPSLLAILHYAAPIKSNAGTQAPIDDRAITLSSHKDVITRRTALIKYLWGPSGLPSSKLPSRTPVASAPIHDLENVRRIDELRVDMDAGEFGIGYHIIASRPNNRLVVVQNGHGCSFDESSRYEPPGSETVPGLRRAISELLADGFSVLAIFMPRSAPSDCRYQTHDDMFNIPVASGHAMKFFLEPTVVMLNYVRDRSRADQFPTYTDYNMLGLSGGGWTTTVYAAIDPTIHASFPVIGSLPLYLRGPRSMGDREQTDPEFYSIAGYLDLYVMAASGKGRQQIQILNRSDKCCFGQLHDEFAAGIPYDDALRDYESRVRSAVTKIGPGAFRLVIDDTNGHMISPHALETIIIPTLKDPASQAFQRASMGYAVAAQDFQKRQP